MFWRADQSLGRFVDNVTKLFYNRETNEDTRTREDART